MSSVQNWEEKSIQSKIQKLNTWVDEVKELPSDRAGDKVGIFGEFTQSSTVHGLKHTYGAGRGLFRKGFWCCAFLGMLVGLLYTVVTQLVLLMKYPTITKQSIEFRGTMPFPAVTLCNLNRFRKSIAADEASKQFLVALSDIGSQHTINWDDPQWANLSEKAGDIRENIQYISHSLNSTLFRCKWDNKPYACDELFKSRVTDFGLCFTFNARENVNSTQRIAIHQGSKYGLTVIANILHDEYLLDSSSDAAGLRVLLHDFDETPLVEGRGFDVGPGYATKGSLNVKHLKFLPPPYKAFMGRECTNTSSDEFSNFLKLYDHYDMSACIFECRYNYVVNICNCQSIFDSGNISMCSGRKLLECYIPSFEEFMEKNLAMHCDCPMPCVQNIYAATVSTAFYPSKAMMEQANTQYNISMDEDEFRRNILKLTLAYDFFMLESIEHVPEYGFETSMSTLGGQLGIFLGASLLSLLEFLELGLVMLIYKVFRVGNKAPKKQSS